MQEIFPTTVIGSYPKPKWLNTVRELNEEGKFEEEKMEEAEDDAVRLIVKEQERAGIDVLSDGEMRREEMVEFFAECIPGFEFNGPVRVWGNNYYDKPSVVEELQKPGPMLVEEFKFTQKITDRAIKVPITGPYTLTDWSFNEVYKREELVMRLAEILNQEIKRLVDAGAKYIQLDEPALSTHPEEVDIIKESTEKVFRGIDVEKKFMHVCYGKIGEVYPEILEFDIDQFALEFANNNFKMVDELKQYEFTKELGFGCLDAHVSDIEEIGQIKENIKKGLEVVPPERLWVNPDCGVKLLPRNIAYKKLKNMTEATEELRKEY